MRIERRVDRCALLILGPGDAAAPHEFADEETLIAFQANYEGRLRGDGWVLQAYEDRRSGRDRREAPRGPDRRRARDA